MKKNSRIHIDISKEIKDKLKKKAENSGLSLSSYCLFVLQNAVVKIEYSTEISKK